MSTATELLDSIYYLKQKRDAIVETYNDQIDRLTIMLERRMREEGKNTMEFDLAMAFFRKQTKVEVEDWNEVMQCVKRNDAFDILQRRIAPAQLEKRIAAGMIIKGVKISHEEILVIKGKKENEK